MDHRIPEPLTELVRQLARLPGLGPKSAMRAAMTLLKWPESETRRLGSSIHDLRDKLRLCSRCGALTDTDPCTVCADPARDDSLLCLVAEWDSMLTLEEGAFFRGRYLILGGLLPPPNMAGESPDLDRLLDRLAEGQVREVILALGDCGGRKHGRIHPGACKQAFSGRASDATRPGHPPWSRSQIHGSRDIAPVAPVPAGTALKCRSRHEARNAYALPCAAKAGSLPALRLKKLKRSARRSLTIHPNM